MSRLGKIIKLGLNEARKNKEMEHNTMRTTKVNTTMTTYRNVMKYSAIAGLVGLGYYSIQVNSSLTIPMALTHALAIYAITLNKERQ